MFSWLLACGEPDPGKPEPGTTPTTPTTEPTTEEPPWPDVGRIPLPSSVGVSRGEWQLETGEELYEMGQGFYARYPDAFDVLFVFTEEPVADIYAFAVPLAHDIEGIGQEEVMELYGWSDLSPATAGSAGRLQHIVLMNNPSLYPESNLYSVDDILVHETAHRWGANLSAPWAADRWVLVDRWWSHWNVHASTGGASALGYGRLDDLGGGQFHFQPVVPLAYAPLELYQMGLVGADEVDELYHVEATTDYDPATWYGQAWSNDAYGSEATYSGTRRDFDMDQVVAAHGPRVPDTADAQREFSMGFALVCADVEACDEEDLAWVDATRQGWPAAWSAATGGRASARTEMP